MVATLGVCELFHPKIHGMDQNSSSNIIGQHLVRYSIELDEFMDDDLFDDLTDDIAVIRRSYNRASKKMKDDHPHLIRNYKKIISHSQYPNIDIMDIVRLEPGQEDVAILKTCWLRIFQRKWKSYYKQQQALLDFRKQSSSIRHREIHGNWPQMN